MQFFLENDTHSKSDEQELLRQSFETTQDLSLIRGLAQGLPDDHIDRAIIIFSRLAMFFNSGILLENTDQKWKAQAFFHQGITELLKNTKLKPTPLAGRRTLPTDKQDEHTTIHIPNVNLMTVLKTDSTSILKKLNLSHIDPDNKTICMLIKVTPDFAFLLFSALPEIWLHDHIENIRRALINGFTD